jgi:signal transduction histidine kinase
VTADGDAPGQAGGVSRPGPRDSALTTHAEDLRRGTAGTGDLHAHDARHGSNDSTGLTATIAEEQGVLRRLATLVARGAEPEAVFASVAEEAAALFDADFASMVQLKPDGETVLIAGYGFTYRHLRPRFALGPHFAAAQEVWRTGRAFRLDADDLASMELPEEVRAEGADSSVNAGILVDGRIWGLMGVASRHGPLPPSTEERLVSFTELIAIAVASAQTSSELRAFGEEQAALRRVATLVARGATSEDVFMAVAEEAGRLLKEDFVAISRYDPDGTTLCVASWSADASGRLLPIGVRRKREGRNIQTLVFESGQPKRLDDHDAATGETADDVRDLGLRASVGVPIWVGGRLWGNVTILSRHGPLPPGTEAQLAGFTELAATAIANAQAQAELREFAREQAALRRVATLVARTAPPAEVFDAVTEETRRLLGADLTGMSRYDPDGTITVLSWAGAGVPDPLGSRFAPGGHNTSMLVFQTGQPARIDDFSEATGPTAEPARELLDVRAAVSVPIKVEGRLWGIMGVLSIRAPLPPDTEERLARFTELAATAVANAEAGAALTASRARIVAAADATRQRIERDLHDAAQERLASLARHLRAAQAAAPKAAGFVQLLDSVITDTKDVLEQLREIARGLHPSVLSNGGLHPALTALARRSPIPVQLDVRVAGRLPEPVELAAYYGVSEALANTAKHADASEAEVEVINDQGTLRVLVRDDGRGGADFNRGSGLAGLRDRVEAVGGRISLRSQPGAGTTMEIGLPL